MRVGGFSAMRKVVATVPLLAQSALHQRKRLKTVCASDGDGLAAYMDRKSINDCA
jgi:hypothetical protein